MKKTIKSEIDDIVSNILEDYNEDRIINRMEVFTQPDTEVVLDIMDKLIKIIYPGYYRDGSYRFYNINSRTTVLLEDVMYNLNKQIALALPQNPDNQNKCAEKLDAEAGATVTFDQVIAISDGALKVGEDVKASTVSATVMEQGRARKVIVYKYKRKTGYHKKNGHRQAYTQVKIDKINA